MNKPYIGILLLHFEDDRYAIVIRGIMDNKDFMWRLYHRLQNLYKYFQVNPIIADRD
jgi:hypothetical protein